MNAITAADREIYQRKQKIEEEKWKIVADHLKASRPTTNYSRNACRDRFQALENGTATIPPELADYPEEPRNRPLTVTKGSPVHPSKARHGQDGVDTGLGEGADDTNHTCAPASKSERGFGATITNRGPSAGVQATVQTTKYSNIVRPVYKGMARPNNDALPAQEKSSDGNAKIDGNRISSSE